MACGKCGKETVLIDYPMQEEYHNEDTEWGIWPYGYDPGWLVAKSGARPINMGCDKNNEKKRGAIGGKAWHYQKNCIT